MAVLIRQKLKKWSGEIIEQKLYKGYKNANPIYQEQAKIYDEYIKKEIKRIEEEVFSLGYLKKIGGIKDAKCHHWVGQNLKRIRDNDSIHKIDRRWVIESIQYHAGKKSPIYHKNRTENRIAYNYDIFLSELTLEDVNILNWGEWTTVFDTRAFHTDGRAMKWLKENLEKFKIFRDKRKAIRTLFPSLNAEFCRKNRDLNYLTDEEFMTEINDIFDDFLKSNEGV